MRGMHRQSRKNKTTPRGTWPAATSWAVGGSSPAPGTPRRSKSDKATDFAAAQARRHLHLRYQAALTQPRRTLTSETGLLAGQTPEERFRFFRPPASNFARDHHLPHATIPRELWVSPLFASACFSQGDTCAAPDRP